MVVAVVVAVVAVGVAVRAVLAKRGRADADTQVGACDEFDYVECLTFQFAMKHPRYLS